MFYDVTQSPRGTSRARMTHPCDICHRRSDRTWELLRGADDEDSGEYDEQITVCEPCLVDAMLDGTRP